MRRAALWRKRQTSNKPVFSAPCSNRKYEFRFPRVATGKRARTSEAGKLAVQASASSKDDEDAWRILDERMASTSSGSQRATSQPGEGSAPDEQNGLQRAASGSRRKSGAKAHAAFIDKVYSYVLSFELLSTRKA